MSDEPVDENVSDSMAWRFGDSSEPETPGASSETKSEATVSADVKAPETRVVGRSKEASSPLSERSPPMSESESSTSDAAVPGLSLVMSASDVASESLALKEGPDGLVASDPVESEPLVADDEPEASDVDELSEPVVSAAAIAGIEAIAMPTPKATASAPTRPTYREYPGGGGLGSAPDPIR
ncbi:MAG: hypothetical protein ACPGVG_16360 [Mycobacterium sp.]